MMRQLLASTIFFLVTSAVVAAPADSANPPVAIEVPLEDGKLNVRDVIVGLCEELDLERPRALDHLNWSIDVHSILGRVQLHALDRLSDGALRTELGQDRVMVQIDRERLGRRLLETGESAERWLADLLGGATARQHRVYGLTWVTARDSAAPLIGRAPVPSRAVVLVHGLDDPGFMWRDLIPALHQEGLPVLRFEYPNDSPIADAADLLASELARAKSAGVQRVDVIAHSMGGLVARDVLTRAAHYAGDGSGSEKYPAIDRLIMLGTPNHGSKMARLRLVGELREHLYRLWNGESKSLNSVLSDGMGEAGRDLLPDSDFLRRLNARPLARHTQHTIIAGRWSPLTTAEVDALGARVRELVDSKHGPSWLREWNAAEALGLASALVADAADGVGDGCVSIESARLEGVDDIAIVRANHLSMIVNMMGSAGTPPAIPLILERLANPAP